jgi:hypothetical protein
VLGQGAGSELQAPLLLPLLLPASLLLPDQP